MTASEKSVLCDGDGSQQQVRKVCVEQFAYLSTSWQCQVSFTCHHNLTQSGNAHFLHLDSYEPCCSVCKNEISSSATRARLIIRDMHGVRRVTMNLTHVAVVVTCGIWRVTVNFMNVSVSLTMNFMNVPLSLMHVAFEGWQWSSSVCLYPWLMWYLKGGSELYECACILDTCGIWKVAVNFTNVPVCFSEWSSWGWRCVRRSIRSGRPTLMQPTMAMKIMRWGLFNYSALLKMHWRIYLRLYL